LLAIPKSRIWTNRRGSVKEELGNNKPALTVDIRDDSSVKMTLASPDESVRNPLLRKNCAL
jgi:hypothetical protein